MEAWCRIATYQREEGARFESDASAGSEWRFFDMNLEMEIGSDSENAIQIASYTCQLVARQTCCIHCDLGGPDMEVQGTLQPEANSLRNESRTGHVLGERPASRQRVRRQVGDLSTGQ